MDLTESLVAVVAGLVAGGFATMLVARIPDGTPLGIRSRCPRCGDSLPVIDTLPIMGWVLRRGRCRHCAEPVTVAYPVVELVVAGLFVLIVREHGLEWLAVPPAVLAIALVALSVIDMYEYRLPDRLVFPSIGISAVLMVVVAVAIDRPEGLTRALVGSLTFFAILLVVHLISPRGMGFGDVKLALLLGLHLGWTAGTTYLGWPAVIRMVFYALLIGCLIGVVMGLLVAVLRRGGRDVAPDPALLVPEEEDGGDEGDGSTGQPAQLLKHSFPFGPALAAATLLVVLYPDLVVPT